MLHGDTEIVYILDRSGSMSGLEADTVGGFNSMIKKQINTEKRALVSVVLFNDKTKVLYDRVPIYEVGHMRKGDYTVYGSTALLDAVGGAIHHIGNVHKYAREEDVPEKTIFVIMTDGMENASRRYSYEQVQRMIKRQQRKYGWEFIFIGANIDAYAEANRFGIRKDRAVNYVHDRKGTASVYDGVSRAVCAAMLSPSLEKLDDYLDESRWSEDITADYLKRGNNK